MFLALWLLTIPCLLSAFKLPDRMVYMFAVPPGPSGLSSQSPTLQGCQPLSSWTPAGSEASTPSLPKASPLAPLRSPEGILPPRWPVPDCCGAPSSPLISSRRRSHHSQDNQSHQIPAPPAQPAPLTSRFTGAPGLSPREVTPQMQHDKTELTVLPGAAAPATAPLYGLCPLPATPSPHRPVDERPFVLPDSAPEQRGSLPPCS